MARYLVIEFADNASADKLIAQINSARERGALYRVVGLFVKPRNLCKCPGADHGSNYQKPGVGKPGIVYGKKYGWWVCTECNRPRKAGHNLVNQLKGEDLYEEPSEGAYEMVITNLGIYGQEKRLLDRLKVRRRKDAKAEA